MNIEPVSAQKNPVTPVKTSALPQLRSNSRINNQSFLDQINNKHKQMNTDMQEFIVNKSDALKNIN